MSRTIEQGSFGHKLAEALAAKGKAAIIPVSDEHVFVKTPEPERKKPRELKVSRALGAGYALGTKFESTSTPKPKDIYKQFADEIWQTRYG